MPSNFNVMVLAGVIAYSSVAGHAYADPGSRGSMSTPAKEKKEKTAKECVRLEGKAIFKGEWATQYKLVNTSKDRAIKVKITRLNGERTGGWPVKETVYQTLEPGEEEDWGTYSNSWKFTPEILGVWYASEAPAEEKQAGK